MQRNCMKCDKKFHLAVHNKKFCNSECRESYYINKKQNKEVVCKECSIKFIPSVHNQIFCNNVCRKVGQESKKLFNIVEQYAIIKELIAKKTILDIWYENNTFSIDLDYNDKILDDLIRKNDIISPKTRAKLLGSIFREKNTKNNL